MKARILLWSLHSADITQELHSIHAAADGTTGFTGEFG
jgi:hypothetical protein